jgi:voltage-gated potassium channel
MSQPDSNEHNETKGPKDRLRNGSGNELPSKQPDSDTAPERASMRADEIAEVTHPIMFYASVVFLGLLSILLVLWIYVPVVIEPSELPPATAIGGEIVDGAAIDGENATGEEVIDLSLILTPEEIELEERAYRWGLVCLSLMLVMWPGFIVERFLDRFLRLRDGSRPSRLWWVSCVAPPLRLCARRAIASSDGVDDAGGEIWFPRAGWLQVDRRLQRNLEKAFSLPMIFIALLILPVLGVQLYFASAKHNIIDYPTIRFLLNFGTGLIWFAFTIEFIVMVSVADKKFAYCKKHWLDLVIILLPLVSFLRSFSLLRATRLAKLGKLQQLSRLVRVYRLRGVAMRALRALMLLEVLHRLLKTKPEKRIAKLQEQYQEKQRELEHLAEEIQRLEALAASQADATSDKD